MEDRKKDPFHQLSMFRDKYRHRRKVTRSRNPYPIIGQGCRSAYFQE
jgi:hypothetical protein